MATSNTNQNSTDVFLRDLLECPVCMETIKCVPVYQCTNGHVICKDCIKELNNCPICRNNSAPARSLQLEKIIQRLEGFQLKNEEPATAKPNLQKWGKGSVRVYGTSDGPNLQATPRQATPQQATPRQARSNQDEEAALLQREQVRNWTQSITTFFKIVGIFFCGIIAPVVIISLFCGCVLLSWYLLTIIIPIKCNPNLNPQCRSP